MKDINSSQFQFSSPSKNDLGELGRIWESCKYIEEWTDDKSSSDDTLEDFFINNENLPPGGKKENSKIFTIFSKAHNCIIGYIQYYLGFPDEQTIWLTTLIIDKKYQGNNFGQTIVDLLLNELKKMNTFTRVQLIASMKNWPAIRFWARNGFSKIIDIKGDKVYSENAFANIILENRLEK